MGSLNTRHVCQTCKTSVDRVGTGPRPKFCSLACHLAVEVLRGSPDECWNWTGLRNDRGYGRFHFGKKNILAHRAAWIAVAGKEIPDGMVICHSCDNRTCCNPAHLFLGTQSDNMQDCVRKGRKNNPQGERHPRSKLTEDIVRQIKACKSAGDATAVATRFNTSQSHVSNIWRGERWGHLS